MDCCNYGEYRAHGHSQYAGGAAGWDGYAPYGLQYAPYTHGYYAAQAHDPYARYSAYRYDYAAHHAQHIEHAMPMDYGAYSSKEMRVRRALARRDARARTTVQHLPLPPTPPLECGMNGRGPGYCEPQMWHHYQMGVMNGGGAWVSGGAGTWPSRGMSCSREQMLYQADYRSMKVPHPHASSMGYSDGRSTPYSMYDEQYELEAASARQTTYAQAQSTAVSAAAAEAARVSRDRVQAESKPPPLEEKRPPVVPLPAFQQAFGSTEIGKFAEAFSRTEVKLDEISAETFPYESFSEWDNLNEPHWSSQPCKREIKCEDNL